VSGLTSISRRSFLIMTAAVAACKPGAEVVRLSGQTMGTTWNIAAVDHGRSVDAAGLATQVELALADVTRAMSNWDQGSELSRLNAAAAGDVLPLSPGMQQVLAAAASVHAASEGRFDVTAGALIDLWGFGAADVPQRLPQDAELAAVMDVVGQGRMLALRDGHLVKAATGTSIYLAAIGKGHGVDRVAEVLRASGLEDFMIEIGGDLYASGRNGNGTPWQIGVEVPLAGASGVHRLLGVSGKGMATSGDYRNFFEHDGQRYSHIIDPTTGRPITHATVSASVLAEDAMLADAWATAMLVLGRARGMEIAEAEGLAVLFIETSDDGLVTSESSHLAALTA
jgi:FAD:protein FMN transferase